MGCGASQAAEGTIEERQRVVEEPCGGSGQLIRTVKIGGTAIHTCRFINSTVAVLGGRLGSLQLYNVRTGDRIESVKGLSSVILSSAVCPEEGGLFVTTQENAIATLWRTPHWQTICPGETTEKICNFEGHKHKVYSSDFSNDGCMLLTGSVDNTVKLWDVERGTCVNTFNGHTQSVFSARFSPDNSFALSAGDDMVVIRWDWRLGAPISKWSGHTQTVWSVCASSDSRECLTAGMEGGAILWDITASKERIRTYEGSRSPTHAAIFSKDEKAVIACGRDCFVRVWDREDGTTLNTMRGHSASVYSMHVNGNHLVTSSYDQTICYWELPTEAAENVSIDGIDFDFGLDDDEDGGEDDPWMGVRD